MSRGKRGREPIEPFGMWTTPERLFSKKKRGLNGGREY